MSDDFDQKIKKAIAAIEVQQKEDLDLQNKKNEATEKLNKEIMDQISGRIVPILESAKKAISSNKIGLLKYNIDPPSMASRPQISFTMEAQKYKNQKISAIITYNKEWYINVSPYKKGMTSGKEKIGTPLDENFSKILGCLIDDFVKISMGYGGGL